MSRLHPSPKFRRCYISSSKLDRQLRIYARLAIEDTSEVLLLYSNFGCSIDHAHSTNILSQDFARMRRTEHRFHLIPFLGGYGALDVTIPRFLKNSFEQGNHRQHSIVWKLHRL